MTGEPIIRTPDVLNTVKYRDKYREHNLHVAISMFNGIPVEVQITVGDFNPATQDDTYANVDAIEGLTNALLQNPNPWSLEAIAVTILGRKSRRPSDLPGKLAKIFIKHVRGMK